jgi:hypothetical protein
VESEKPTFFLEVNGRITGPYTLDQIRGLLQDREIQATTRVTTESMQGRWLTVQEIIEPQVITAQPSGPITPKNVNPKVVQANRPSVNDPVMDLFRALSKSRDKDKLNTQSQSQRADRSERPDRNDAGLEKTMGPPDEGLPAWFKLVLVLVFIGVSGFAYYEFFVNTAQITATPASKPTLVQEPKHSTITTTSDAPSAPNAQNQAAANNPQKDLETSRKLEEERRKLQEQQKKIEEDRKRLEEDRRKEEERRREEEERRRDDERRKKEEEESLKNEADSGEEKKSQKGDASKEGDGSKESDTQPGGPSQQDAPET